MNSKKAPLDQENATEVRKILERIAPIIKQIYSRGAMFVIHKSLNNLTEIFFYLLGLASIAFSFIMNTIFPFHVLGDILSKRIYEEAATNKGDMELFNLSVKALVVIIGLLFIFIGILIRRAGARKTLLYQAGKELKAIETYFLDRYEGSLSAKSNQNQSEHNQVDLLESP